MTPEGKVVAYIRRRVRELGGACRKCAWEGHIGAPDLFVMLWGRHFWIECKAPGKSPREIQLREHEVMREIGGCKVFVADSQETAERILRDE
ncbi:MAG: VRR-NUC domain-containing protein [Oscillospiraceae bacterium]|nr:VRR-NUC domain-containing protein [Oscillospiraceae bacterium]